MPIPYGLIGLGKRKKEFKDEMHFIHEIILRIQEMRKQLNLKDDNHIEVDVAVQDNDVIQDIRIWSSKIVKDVKAQKLTIRTTEEKQQRSGGWQLEKDWDVEGIPMRISISRA